MRRARSRTRIGLASDAGTSPRSPWLSLSASPCGPARMAVTPRNRRQRFPLPPAAAAPTIHEAPAAATDSSAVLHEEIPDVSAGARATIHGRIQVAVRVTVDGAGNVTDAALTNPGSSKYFARLATDAARKWKFAPANDQDPRKRLLIFEFSRSGVAGHATAGANVRGHIAIKSAGIRSPTRSLDFLLSPGDSPCSHFDQFAPRRSLRPAPSAFIRPLRSRTRWPLSPREAMPAACAPMT